MLDEHPTMMPSYMSKIHTKCRGTVLVLARRPVHRSLHQENRFPLFDHRSVDRHLSDCLGPDPILAKRCRWT